MGKFQRTEDMLINKNQNFNTNRFVDKVKEEQHDS